MLSLLIKVLGHLQHQPVALPLQPPSLEHPHHLVAELVAPELPHGLVNEAAVAVSDHVLQQGQVTQSD